MSDLRRSMEHSDLVLGIVHRFGDLEAAATEIVGREPSRASDLITCLAIARDARSASSRVNFLSSLPAHARLAELLHSEPMEVSSREQKESYKKMLREGSVPPGDLGGVVLSAAISVNINSDPKVKAYLKAKATLAKELAKIAHELPTREPRIVHNLMSFDFGTLFAEYSTEVDVLSNGTKCGRTNEDITHAVGNYNISLRASGYSPKSQPALIQPRTKTPVRFR